MVRQTIYFALITLLLMGCSDDVLDRRGNSGEGRLVLSGIAVESVVGDIQTRAALEQDVIPAAADFTLTIVDASTAQVVKTLQPGATDCFLPVGSYKVRASYGDEAAMSEIPYFFGESNAVTINEGESSTVEIQASLACAVIHPIMDPQLEAQFNWLALTVNESATEKSPKVENIPFGKDFFVRGGNANTYTFALVGENKLGETVTHTWVYNNLVVRTRYKINCNPDLPSFTMPAQPEGNVWSKFIYITPMTAENMTAHKEMADIIIEKVIYEASKDDGKTWIKSEKLSDGRHVIKGLEPSTQYTIRSRFGGVTSSDSHVITTESAQQVENGDMEKWSSTKLHSGNGTWSADLYCDYCTAWNTRNERTTKGAEGANSGGVFGVNKGSGYGVYWRWCSGTWPSSDNNGGSKAAEISTLAFYNKNVSGSWKRESVYNYTRDDGTAYEGYLFTGSFNKDADSYDLGISHTARPVSFSFDYKYQPVASDQCIAYAKLYDADKKEIASTETFNSSVQDTYVTKKLPFNYTDTQKKAMFIGIFFQSGTDINILNMKLVEGDYGKTPYNKDRVVGSVLKIDNVILNYDYE